MSPSFPSIGISALSVASSAASCSGAISERVLAYIGVAIAGAIMLTVIPRWPHSLATVRVHATTAPLLAA